MTVRAWTLAALVVVVAAGSVAGQEAATIQGRVAGLDGQPWAGARVTLHAAPLLWLRDLERPDEVVVAADADGRFTAQVATARRYGIWARDRAAKLVTDVAWARAGQEVRLIEAGDPPRPVKLRLVGLDAWQQTQRLQVRLVDATGAARRLRRDREGRVLLADLPGAACHLEFVDPLGNEIWRRQVPLTRAGRQAACAEHEASRREAEARRAARGLPALKPETGPTLDEDVALVPPPIQVRVKILDPNGKPVAGARLSFSSSTVVRPSTTSDAGGLATLIVPRPFDGHGCLAERAELGFLVHADDYAASLCGVTTRRESALELVRPEQLEADSVETTCRLMPGRTLRGQLVLPADVAPAQVALLASSSGWTRAFERLEQFGSTEIVRPDHQGRFEVRGLQHGYPIYLGLLLTDPLRAALAAGRPPVAGNDVVDILEKELPLDYDVGSIRLSDLRVVERAVTSPGGAPAALARVVVPTPRAAWFPAALAAWCDPDGWTDDRGRCRMVVPPWVEDVQVLRQ